MRLVGLKPSENNFGPLIPSFKSFKLLSRAVNCFKLIESHIQTVSLFLSHTREHILNNFQFSMPCGAEALEAGASSSP